jgi:hypothetical protein
MEMLVPISFFVMIFGICAAFAWGGVQSRRESNETLRRAIESGQPLNPETIEALLRKPGRSPDQDIRGGVTLSFLAVGFIVAGLLASGAVPGLVGWDDDAGAGFFIAAAIVGFIGLGQLVAGFLRRDRKDK